MSIRQALLAISGPGVRGPELRGHRRVRGAQWLGELALALRQEVLPTVPHQKSVLPKADGKFRPLAISTLRDRDCMTAAMLVLEPIFEADLPPEQYAYRPGRNAQHAVVKADGLLFRGHPEVWPQPVLTTNRL